MVVAIYYYLVGNNRRFLIFVTLSVFAKETMVLVPISFFLSMIWREKKISAASLTHLIPPVMLLVWVVILHLKLGAPPVMNVGNLTVPFIGIARRVWLLIDVFPKGWIELLNFLIITCLSIYFLLSLIRRRDPLQVSFAAYGLLISCLHHDIVLIDIYGYGRIIQPLVVFAIIEFLRDRRPMLLLPALVMFLEAFHMFFGGKFHA